MAPYRAIAYCLIKRWPHDHLHAVAFSLDSSSLIWMSIAIDYIFHAGMMVFGGVLALFFAKNSAGPVRRRAGHGSRGRRGTGRNGG